MEEMNQDMQPMMGTVEAKDDFAVAPRSFFNNRQFT